MHTYIQTLPREDIDISSLFLPHMLLVLKLYGKRRNETLRPVVQREICLTAKQGTHQERERERKLFMCVRESESLLGLEEVQF